MGTVAVESSPTRRRRRLGLLLLVGGLAVGCGGGDNPSNVANNTDTTVAGSADPGPAQNGSADSSGGETSKQGSAVATAAPLKVPGLGGNVDQVRAQAEESFEEQCGSKDCVHLVVVPAEAEDPGRDCSVSFKGTDPPEGGFVRPGGTLRLLFDVECESSGGGGGTDAPSGDDSTDAPTGDDGTETTTPDDSSSSQSSGTPSQLAATSSEAETPTNGG